MTDPKKPTIQPKPDPDRRFTCAAHPDHVYPLRWNSIRHRWVHNNLIGWSSDNCKPKS